jgi:Ca2+-binding EF-hand superfamily protein
MTTVSQEVDAAKIKEMFDLFDADLGGTIDSDELATAFVRLGITESRDEVDKLVSQIDVDGSGVIEFREFAEAMQQLFASRDTAAEMSKAFAFMSGNKDRITKDDLSHVAAECNDEQTEVFLQAMLDVADRDLDKAVTFSDFRAMMEIAVQNERSGLDDPRRIWEQAFQKHGARA